MIVLKIEDIDLDKIKFCKTFKNNNNYSIKCFYINNNKKIPLIIQSPDIYIPYNISTKYTPSLEISFTNEIIKHFILNIEKNVKNILKNKKIDSIFKTSLKIKNNFDRLRLYVENNTNIYDINKDIYTGNLNNNFGRVLINLSHIWATEDFCGISWKVSQIQIYPKVVLKEYSFLEEEQTEIEIPDIYYKMIKANVPMMAIKHKMIIDNIDNNIIDKLVDKNKSYFVPNKIMINKLDLSIITLKKVSINKNKPEKKKR